MVSIILWPIASSYMFSTPLKKMYSESFGNALARELINFP
jgi:hypothetical protein